MDRPIAVTILPMRPHRTPLFFSPWQHLPHRPFNRVAAAFIQARLPAPVLERLIARWTQRAGIVSADFQSGGDAVHHIDRIYVRNERLVVHIETAAGKLLLVMVAASLVGGIHLEDWPQRVFMADGVGAMVRMGQTLVAP